MALTEQRCYEILELKGPVDEQQLRKHYHVLAQRYHPDRNQGGEERFKEITAAYNFLKERLGEGAKRATSSPKARPSKRDKRRSQRSTREQTGRASPKEGKANKSRERARAREDARASYRAWYAQHGATSSEEERKQERKGRERSEGREQAQREAGARGAPPRGTEEELLHGLVLPSLRERLAGLRGRARDEFRKISKLGRNQINSWLRRSGLRRRARGADLRLRLSVDLNTLLYGSQQRIAINRPVCCTLCAGAGGDCAKCLGSGRVESRVEVRVEIPPGVEEHQRLRFPGEGGEGLDGEGNGDLELILEPPPLKGYLRRGGNLEMTLLVPPTILERGGQVQVKLLRGLFRLEVPPRSFPGRILRVDGQGLPPRGGGPPGHLKVKLQPARAKG